MAVYFDHKIDAPASAGVAVDIAWHSRHPLLAVSSQNERPNGDVDGCVNLYLDEGELIKNASLQRAHLVSALSWHSTRTILACGWGNGEITVWNEHEQQLHEVLSTHHATVLNLTWHPNGNKLVSLDESGVCAVWRVDGKGRLQSVPLMQCQKAGAMTHCALKPIRVDSKKLSDDLPLAARLAIVGNAANEAALDMLSWGSKSKKFSSQKSKSAMGSVSDDIFFFFGGSTGVIHQLHDGGNCTDVLTAAGPIKALFYDDERDLLVTVTINMMLYQHSVSADSVATAVREFKLSGKPPLRSVIQLSGGCIATCSIENVIRVWDLVSDDHYSLDLSGLPDTKKSVEVTCIDYNKTKGVLAAGTNAGHVVMWQYKGVTAQLGQTRKEGSERWERLANSKVDGSISVIQWGAIKNLIAINTTNGVQILNENVMNSSYRQQLAAVQVAPGHLSVESFQVSSVQDLKTDIHIKGVFVTKDHVTVWNGKKVVVYELQPLIRVAGTFNCKSMIVVVSESNVYSVEGHVVNVRNFQGIIKQSLSFTEDEGAPLLLDICKSFLVVGTFYGYVKLWDISRREAKQHFSSKCIAESVDSFAGLSSVKCNCAGNQISVLAYQVERGKAVPSSYVYIWNPDVDSLLSFDFSTASDKSDVVPTNSTSMTGKEELIQSIRDRYPLSTYWDGSDPRLLLCETRRLESRDTPTLVATASKTDEKGNGAGVLQGDVIVVSLFATSECGILLHDNIPLDVKHTGLIGVDVPYLFYCKKVAHVDDKSPDQTSPQNLVLPSLSPALPPPPQPPPVQHMVARTTMRDFVGLEESNEGAKTAMMNFLYYLTIGNMDEAFKAIKLIKSESVWENMARMCVKTKRLDVAFICLGNMGHARGAKALREAMSEPEVDARVAMLALQLGMKEEAEQLYKSCGRHDLLNQFYQAEDNWVESIHVAETKDRVHLRTTYYNFAQHSEASGNFMHAINAYEKSDTHRTEVPRLLYNDPGDLEAYVMKSKDRVLRRWWAQYLESTGDMDSALQFYDAAQDYVSLVRVLCYCGRIDQAAEVANDSGDKAACYHLARQFENVDRVKDAIHYYSKAQCFTNAIKLTKEQHLHHELMNLALQGTQDEMLDAARYFESQPGMEDKAVLLYHKGGDIGRALTLSFRSKQFSALQMMAGDLNEQTDPVLLDRCAQFFLEHEQYDKAVDLLVKAKKHFEALDLCMSHNVQITEDMAERLTLPKPSKEEVAEASYRTRLLEHLASCCMAQSSYHLATKKYTQAGNKLKAMKALIKSRDIEKIVFFTNVSRQREIYVMAANFLQQQEWQKDTELMKHIISFYTKGKAFESLAGFYDACAQFEIDEYQKYDKALGALKEALKCMTKAKTANAAEQEQRVAFLKQRIAVMKKFVDVKLLYDEQPEEAIKQCQLLLDEPDLEASVRPGDVYGFMVMHYAREENYRQSYALMEEMRRRVPHVNMAYFINMRVIETVHRALDIPLGRGMGAEMLQDDVIEEEIEGEDDQFNGEIENRTDY